MLSTPSERNDPRYFVYHRDGWQDLFIGLGVVMAGTFILGDLPWMAAIFIPILLPPWQAARKRFLERRLGVLEPASPQAARGLKAVLSTSLILGLLVMGVAVAFYLTTHTSSQALGWMRQYFIVLLGALFGALWLYFAFALRLPRFTIYGLLTIGLFCAVQYTGLSFGLALISLGAAIVIIGLFILTRFISKHPVLD